MWDSVTGPFYYVAIYWCPSDRIPYQSLVRNSGFWPKITGSLPGDVRDIITCECAKSRLSFNSIHVFVFRNDNHWLKSFTNTELWRSELSWHKSTASNRSPYLLWWRQPQVCSCSYSLFQTFQKSLKEAGNSKSNISNMK